MLNRTNSSWTFGSLHRQSDDQIACQEDLQHSRTQFDLLEQHGRCMGMPIILVHGLHSSNAIKASPKVGSMTEVKKVAYTFLYTKQCMRYDQTQLLGKCLSSKAMVVFLLILPLIALLLSKLSTVGIGE